MQRMLKNSKSCCLAINELLTRKNYAIKVFLRNSEFSMGDCFVKVDKPGSFMIPPLVNTSSSGEGFGNNQIGNQANMLGYVVAKHVI